MTPGPSIAILDGAKQTRSEIMPEFSRLTGIDQLFPNAETKDIRFVLSVSEGEPIICTASYGVAAQISSGLGTAIQVLRIVGCTGCDGAGCAATDSRR